MTQHQHEVSVFDVLDSEFQTLVTRGFKIEGRRVSASFPDRPMSPLDIKERLLHPSTSFEARDVAWRYFISEARRHENWMTIALGLLQPGMRCAAAQVVRVKWASADEVDSEFLTGVIEAMVNMKLDKPKVVQRLLNAGYARARSRVDEPQASMSSDEEAVPENVNNPELALWRAVAADVITADDAELIAANRLGGQSLQEICLATISSVDTLRHRRWRAERALRSWLIETL